MSVSILEALQNADYNLQFNRQFGIFIAKDQVHNAVKLLEKGYNINTLVEPLLEKWGDVDSVPDIVNNEDFDEIS